MLAVFGTVADRALLDQALLAGGGGAFRSGREGAADGCLRASRDRGGGPECPWPGKKSLGVVTSVARSKTMCSCAQFDLSTNEHNGT